MDYKVVIIGAGPGGTVLARELAKSGIDVTIYEKGDYNSLGHNWSDAVEYVALKEAGLDMPSLVGKQWKGVLVKEDPDGEGLFEKHAIPRLRLYCPDYSSVKEIEFRMITTDRKNLGKVLVDQAVSAGAIVKYGYEGDGLLYREKGNSSAEDVEVYGVRVKNLSDGQVEDIEAHIVVESSGFASVLRKSLPAYTGLAQSFKDSEFGFVNREVRLRKDDEAKTDIIPDHYRYGYHQGYQWSHEHNDKYIDIGAGVKNDPENPDPKDLIEEFISRHPSVGEEKVRGGRGLCIVGPPLKNFVTNGFFVIGDAASTSVPTTGCGAGSAILVALWSSEVIKEAAKEGRNDISALWGINKKFYIENDRGASFAALSALRGILQSLTHDQLNFLFRFDIMDKEALEDAVNGIFSLPKFKAKLKSLGRGLLKPKVLLKLNKATGKGAKIYSHYRNYPQSWDREVFAGWSTEAEKLFED